MAFIGQVSNEINDSPVKAADVSSVVPETVEMSTKTMSVANGARYIIPLARRAVSVLQGPT